MKRKIVMAVLIVATVICQCSLFQIFEIASVKPNLLVILTVSFGLMRGRMSGLITGFAGGLCMDLFYPGLIGLNALLYMWIGYASGYCYRIFYDDDIKTPLLLVTAGDLFYSNAMYVLTFLLRGRIHFWFYIKRIIIPELLYTIIATLILYHIFYRINRSLSKSDKRSLDSFA